jgi:hypothetical protein
MYIRTTLLHFWRGQVKTAGNNLQYIMNLGKLEGNWKNVVNDGKNVNYGNVKAGFYCILISYTKYE